MSPFLRREGVADRLSAVVVSEDQQTRGGGDPGFRGRSREQALQNGKVEFSILRPRLGQLNGGLCAELVVRLSGQSAVEGLRTVAANFLDRFEDVTRLEEFLLVARINGVFRRRGETDRCGQYTRLLRCSRIMARTSFASGGNHPQAGRFACESMRIESGNETISKNFEEFVCHFEQPFVVPRPISSGSRLAHSPRPPMFARNASLASAAQAPSSKLFFARAVLSCGSDKSARSHWRCCFRFTMPSLVEVQRRECKFNSERDLNSFHLKNNGVRKQNRQ